MTLPFRPCQSRARGRAGKHDSGRGRHACVDCKYNQTWINIAELVARRRRNFLVILNRPNVIFLTKTVFLMRFSKEKIAKSGPKS